ncbi:MAG: Stp1/IreP family PP2C-type Ser/Thr phosphatase [Candidatus Howiella sp.]|jgi:serine/threonine protein phosphatase PrpC
MKIVSKTDVGLVRQSNQDSYAAGEMPGGVAWAVVCDGMGGANGGNIASATAVKMISEMISSTYREGMSSNSIRTMLQSAVYAANVSVFDMAKSVESLSGMGTTVVAAVVSHGLVHVVHAGDSRAYIVSDTGMDQITRDHSIVQSMIEDGSLSPDEAKLHPRKNIITRALGVEESIEIDYNEVGLAQGQRLLICTDGLTNYIEPPVILEVLQQYGFYEYPEKLIERANQNGGGDNITVVVISD